MIDVTEILEWLESHREACPMTTSEIPVNDIPRWRVDPLTGSIEHVTGEFFRVVGIKVQSAREREVVEWSQPMIYQREMGILGLLVQRQGDTDRYLLQAKAEPGNVGRVLLSPTLQSTLSNLKRAHGGGKSLFASFFEDMHPDSLVYCRNQAEDGGRFYLKTNLNMIVRAPECLSIGVPSNFRWVSLPEIKALLQYENLVAIAVRSIIAAI